jgi:nifR3 family TIM-barrel protein
MRVGDVIVDPPLVLAPMEGVTDRLFRRLIRRIGGVGLTTTEFVPARSLAADAPRARAIAEVDADEHPVAIQVYGRDPAVLAEAVRVAEGLGADIVDLNMGCPSKAVCAHSGGSALLKDPALVVSIVRAMRAAATRPFTVKMRAGFDASHRNAPEIARLCVAEGVDAVTVHWRTRADGYGGVRDLDVVAAVVDAVDVPVVANGDVVDAASAVETLRQTGAAGLMVGRGAVRDPWVFRRIGAALAGQDEPVVDLAEREALLLGWYADVAETFATERGAVGRMKKVIRWFADGVPGGEALRDAVWHAEGVVGVTAAVARFFADARAAEQERGRCPDARNVA